MKNLDLNIYNMQKKNIRLKQQSHHTAMPMTNVRNRSFYDIKHRPIQVNELKPLTDTDVLREKAQNQQAKNKLLKEFIMQFHYQQFQQKKYNSIIDFVKDKLYSKKPHSSSYHQQQRQSQNSAGNQQIMNQIDQLINENQIDDAYVLKQQMEVFVKKQENLELQNSKLQHQLYSYQSQIKNNMTQINQSNKLIQQFQDTNQYAEKSKILIEKNSQIKQLNDTISRQQEQIDHLQNDLTQKILERDDYHNQVQKLQTYKEKISYYENVMAENKITISSQNKQISILSEQVEENSKLKYNNELGHFMNQFQENLVINEKDPTKRFQSIVHKQKHLESIKVRKINSFDIAHLQLYIRHQLRKNNIQFNEINQYIFNSNQQICTIEQIFQKLKQQPFQIKNQDDALLFARYLIESDQFDDSFLLNMHLAQNINVVDSILKFFIKKYSILDKEQQYTIFLNLANQILENKSKLEKEIQKINKQNDLCPITLLIKMLDFQIDQKDLIFDWVYRNVQNQKFISLHQFFSFWSKFYLNYKNDKNAYLQRQEIFNIMDD